MGAMIRLRTLAPLVLFCSSCSRDAPSSAATTVTAEVKPLPAPISSPPPAGSASAPAPVAPPAAMGAARIVPPVPLLEPGMMDHLLPSAGWTKDGTALGYSVSIAVSRLCDLVRPNGAQEHFEAESEEVGGKPGGEKKFFERVRALHFLGNASGPWPYAGELELTWESLGEGCSKNPPVAEGIQVGARVPGEPPGYAIKLFMPVMDGGPCYSSAHPELIAISPDGKYLGAIAHGFAGEWANAYPMGIAPVTAVAEGAFNDAGLAHHRKGSFSRAAELFRKAVLADPTSKAATYNLACALARLGDAGAEAALADAIARGGDETIRKARKDADFAGVSAKPWFTAMMGAHR